MSFKTITVAYHLEKLKKCMHCGAEFDPPNLILQGLGYFYVICVKCGFESRVWIIADEPKAESRRIHGWWPGDDPEGDRR